ncbi:hypothetical protein IJG79_02170 [Candidatus Saccharibacteria bacterium]|nr:hypothetical protein [Candidatus Saccharibacteria bacterium]
MYVQGVYARLWSSSIVSSTSAYRLGTGSTAVRPAESVNKADGYALHCAMQISILVMPLHPVWLWQ